jgi:uncharacterized repeat protein (TIGR01451 family)
MRHRLALALALATVTPLFATQSFQLLEVIPPSAAANKASGEVALIEPPNGAFLMGIPDPAFTHEVEPNGTSGAATPLPGSSATALGNIFAPADQDMYSFTAATGDRVYAATQTLFDASASGDSVLELIGTDGTTVLETDNNDGTFNASSSSIAGFSIPAPGTYFLRVRHNVGTGTIRPYHLHFRLQSGAPVAEVEANNTPATATPLPASGWVSGTITAVSPGESDFFSITLAAGDSVYLSLDMNPERDAAVWNGRLGFGLFGNPPANQILLANDANAGAGAADPNSEAFFFTVKDPGTYFIYVDSIVAAGLGANATYHLSVSVRPAVPATASCTTYTSTDVPQTIPTGPGSVSSTITVPGNPRIADLDVSINLNHTFMADLDAHLVSPAGNDNGLFTDIGAATVGGPQTLMDLRLDDEAALPFAFALSASWINQPELAYRLSWFDGEDAGGTWTLVLRDDATGDGGTLNAWSLTICEPPPPPACPAGAVLETVYSSDFEADDGGFTHAGVQDEWERGLPNFQSLTTCNSGANCWVTDLDNTYNASSNQDLESPAIDLSNHIAPVTLIWAQRYHIESASFDHYSVDFRESGGANPTRVFEWLDATMNNTVGSPTTTIAESAGWGIFRRDVSAYAGLATEVNFHLDSDTTVQLAGVAIDDVSVTACRLLSADLQITKTDGVATAVPGGSVTYTITASNAGPDTVLGATIADTFPAVLTCSWTCVGAGGGTCTTGPVAGNINDAVDLPSGASVTYTANCSIDPAATGSLSNTATVSSAIADPNPANNSATDTDTLTPQADLVITKTDGLAAASPGQAITYTIVASNPGLSNAPSNTVADTFPAALTGASWTCVGAGGGTCTAGPTAGNINDVVNLPAGGSVTYTVNGTIDGAFLGLLSNTATVTIGGGVTETNPANNSATDNTDVVSAAVLSGTKTVAGDFQVGGTIFYTVIISNTSSSAQLDNPGDEFVDVLPVGLTLVGATASSGTAVANVGLSTVTWNGSIPGSGSVTITIEATIDAGTEGQTLFNQGTINFDADGNGTNESSTVTDDPGVGGAGDPTALDVALGQVNPLEIPTNSGLGLTLLALVLAAAGLSLRRRQLDRVR